MRMRVGMALVAAAAATMLTSTAGATGGVAGSARVDLSTRTAVVKYLRSIGVDPAGVVIQRGAHNHAGVSCPGKRWNCTSARRVVQISTSTKATNDASCTPGTSTSNSCVIVQAGPGDNTAYCTLAGAPAGATQSCSITQTNTTGVNNATVTENLSLTGTGTTGSQDVTVDQTNGSGPNEVVTNQKLIQNASQDGSVVAESQTATQSFKITQTADTGSNTATAAQSVSQKALAPGATTGSQSQSSDLKGELDQSSAGVSTLHATQTELQRESAKAGGAVSQTQVGPEDCCSVQTGNPADSFNISQSADQNTSSNTSTQDETQHATYVSSGNGTETQTATQDGTTQTTTQSGSSIDSTNSCTNGACSTTQPPTFATGDIFVSVGDGKVQWRHADGSLVGTLDDGTGSSETTGLALDSAADLYVTDYTANTVSEFDRFGNLIGIFGSGYDTHPESMVFDSIGNAYVGQSDGTRDVLKFDAAGTPLASYDVTPENRGSDWLDLASDQCTLYYTSEGTLVKRFNVCTNTQLSDFASGLPGSDAYEMRLLPDGGALVADTSSIVRLDSSGAIVQSYNVPDVTHFWFSLNLNNDGTSFWAGDPFTGDVVRFDIATGAVVQSFNTGVSSANEAGGIIVR